MDILASLHARAEQVEVMNLRSESTTVAFDANRLKSSQVEETKGTAVRIIRNGRLGFAACSDDSPAAIQKLIANALESATFGETVSMAFPPPHPGPAVQTYDRAIVELSVERLVELGREAVEMIRAVDADARVNVTVQRGVEEKGICNQTGSNVVVERSPLSIRVHSMRIKGDDVLAMYTAMGATVMPDDPLACVRNLCEKMRLAQQPTSIVSKHMPVLFSPPGAMVLCVPLLEGVNGRNVYKGVSPLAGKVGQKVFHAGVTLVDDATLHGCYASAAYDDEGMAHRRNVLVQEGVAQGFLYDLKTAAQSGVASTGNGSRGLFDAPHPEPTNLILEAGDTPLASMIAGLDEGLLVDDALGLGQGNVTSGAFSNSLNLAFKIERGAIAGRVKNVSIAGNIYDALRDVAAVSQEREWVWSRFYLPWVLLPELNVVT